LPIDTSAAYFCVMSRLIIPLFHHFNRGQWDMQANSFPL
jgi:hypothetical protein